MILLSTYSEADLPADAGDCGAIAYVHKEDFGPALVRELWDSSRRLTAPRLSPLRRHGRDRVEREPASTCVPEPGRAVDRERAADRADPVGHVDEAVAAHRAARRVEAGTVVGDGEAQLARRTPRP